MCSACARLCRKCKKRIPNRPKNVVFYIVITSRRVLKLNFNYICGFVEPIKARGHMLIKTRSCYGIHVPITVTSLIDVHTGA
jgi:hypothetical protein